MPSELAADCVYAYFAVFERKGFGGEVEDQPGRPARYCLLYISDEGVITYHALYRSYFVSPLAIMLKRSDGFTFNWTNFGRPDEHLAQQVMGNPAGQPEFVYSEGQPFDWPWYGPPDTPRGLFYRNSIRFEAQHIEPHVRWLKSYGHMDAIGFVPEEKHRLWGRFWTLGRDGYR